MTKPIGNPVDVWTRALRIGFDGAVNLRSAVGSVVVIVEPLVRMQMFKDEVRRLAGKDHPLARLLEER